MAHNKTIQFYRNNTVVRPDTENNKNALSVAKELLDTSGSKQDGEMTLIRYKEDDEDPVKTLVGVYHKNGNTGTWSYLTEDHPYIPFGICDPTSTATEFTVTVPGIDKLEDGVCCIVKNGVVTSASGFTLNVNGLGAKPSYSNMATGNDVTPTEPTRDTTIFNINYAMLFIYSSTIVEGGGWICYRGYDANTNTIAYQVRSNSHSLPASQKFYRYRLLFTSADGTHYVPANTSTSTEATTSKTVNQTPIDPFGHIVYYASTSSVSASSRPSATNLWIIYTLSLGYSFNRSGAALTLTPWTPVYVKCAPQSNGSAIIDKDSPYVQSLPTTADGKIYIFLGVAYSATNVEILNNHPVYYHDGTGIRLWTGKTIPTKTSELTNDSNFVQSTSLATVATSGSYNDLTNKPTIPDIDDAKPFIVTATDPQETGEEEDYVIDKTFAEITAAFNSGKTVVLETPVKHIYYLAVCRPTFVEFRYVSNDGVDTEIRTFSLDNSDSLSFGKLYLNQVAYTGDYNDLRNKPTNVSSFTNDAGYQTKQRVLLFLKSVDTTTFKCTFRAYVDEVGAEISDSDAVALFQNPDNDIEINYDSLIYRSTKDDGDRFFVSIDDDWFHNAFSTWCTKDAVFVYHNGNNEWLREAVFADANNVITYIEPVTYSTLVNTKNGSELKPGQYYRITDYNCTTTQTDTKSAGHQFDILVQATSPNTLSEEAKAIRHEGDTYFADANLEDWKIWYCLDNDTTRFVWADATNGKGVIYRMIDEWGNDCPYDFKNIQFKRYKITATTKTDTSLVGKYMADATTMNGHTVDANDFVWCYTFNGYYASWNQDEEYIDSDNLGSDAFDLSKFDYSSFYDENSTPQGCTRNVIPYYIDGDSISQPRTSLNNIVMYGWVTDVSTLPSDYEDLYGELIFQMMSTPYSNKFGDSCYNNTFGNGCSSNTFGNGCSSNAFGYGFSRNTFGNVCYGNTFGNNCYSNTFGDNSITNTFGNSYQSNTFGNNCSSNTFGNNCSSNTFGNECGNNTFSKPYMRYIIVENGNSRITLTSTQTPTSSNPLRNITIAEGVNNTNTTKTISHNTLKDTFRTTYTTDVSGNIYAIAPAKYAEWDNKQSALVSGTDIKTINNQSLLGSGNLTPSDIGADVFVVNIENDGNDGYTCDKTNAEIHTAWQDGRNIIAIYAGEFVYPITSEPSSTFVTFAGCQYDQPLQIDSFSINTNNNVQTVIRDSYASQEALESGTNIKTINNQSLLGSGNLTPSQLGIPDALKSGSVAGKLYRNNVSGSGNLTISGNSGCIPNIVAGTFLVAIYAKSSTQSYTFRFNFGSVSYDLNTTNGEINDVRQITIPSDGTFSGSVLNGSVASGTILYVVMYNYLTTVSTVGVAAVTNRYSDLDGKPTINDFGAAEAIYLTGELNGAYWTFTDIDGNTLTDAEMIALLNDPNKLISIYYDGFTGTEFPGRGHEATVTRNIGSTNWYFEYIDVERLMYFWLALDEYNGKIHDDEHLVRKLVRQTSLGQGYSTCTTAASDTAKYCDFDYYKLTSGGIVSVKFVYDVPANSTLNVGDTGAHAIYNRGAAIESGVIKGGDTATFMYDGTYYQLISVDSWQDKYTKAEIDDTEEVIAQALSELDERVTANTEAVESIDALTDGLDEWKEEIEDAIESGERVTAMALTDIDERLENEVSAREQLAQELIDDEQAIAGAMALMNNKLEEVSQSVDDNEQIIAGALVDLDQRITDTNQVIEENELITARALNELANGIPTEAEDINAVPMTRTINGFNLSEDITVGKPTIYLDCQRDGAGPRNKLVVFGADELIEAGHVPILLRWSRKRFSKGWHHFRTMPNSSTPNVVTVAKETLSIVYGNSSKSYYRTANVVKLNGGEVIDNAGPTTTGTRGEIYVNHGKRKFYIKDSNGYHNTKTKWGLAFIDPSDIPTNAAQRLDLSRLSTKIAPFYMYYSWTQAHQLVKSML